jgi:putative glutamine amidotransferase
MRPIIGLNTSLADMRDPHTARSACYLYYPDAVAAAGGVPVLIPPYTDRSMLDEILMQCDGFCFIGGLDYDPAHYGGHPQPADQVMHPRQHAFDLCLAEAVVEGTRKPVLGICGGHQLIAIARGAVLVQDLKTEWYPPPGRAPTLAHAENERTGSPQEVRQYRHDVELAPGSRIAKIMGATHASVNSFHHQAVLPERPGAGLVVTAWAPDGVIEAVESPQAGRFLVGVQWHPERLTDEALARALFEVLVAAARGHA